MKILDSLARGRHIISNTLIGEANPELAEGLHLTGTSAQDWIERIKSLLQQSFSTQEIEKRQILFDAVYNNEISVEKMLKEIYTG